MLKWVSLFRSLGITIMLYYAYTKTYRFRIILKREQRLNVIIHPLLWLDYLEISFLVIKKSPRCSMRGLMVLMLKSDLEVLSVHVETTRSNRSLLNYPRPKQSASFFHYDSDIMFESFASLLYFFFLQLYEPGCCDSAK